MATNEDIINKSVNIDVKKFPLLKQDLTSLKTFLIKNKKFNNEDKKAEVLSGVFLPIYKSIQYSEGLDDYRTIACDTLAVWLSRSAHLISDSDPKGIYKETFGSFLDFERSTYLFHYVLDFWNESGAALGNSLKELFIKMIQFLTQVLSPDAKLDLFKGWLLKSLEISHSMRVFYFMIENLFKEVTPKDFVLRQRPHFIKDCLDYIWSNALANSVGKVIFLILRHVYNHNHEYEWVQIWSDNTIIALNNPKLRKHIETYLLPNLFKVSNSATLTFLKIIIKKKDISLLLSCLKIAQETAIISDPFKTDESENSKSIISFETIGLLLKSTDPSYRIGALSLLISSSKVSKQISSPTYKYIFASLEMMLIETDLETKNSLFSYLKKFIARIRDSTYSLNRDAKKLTAKNYEKFREEIEIKLEAIEESKLFLKNLLSYVEKNLRPGSSYQRKAFSFKILIALIKSGLDSRVLEKYHDKHKLVSYQYSIDIYDKLLIRLTVDNISDDFEDIREYSTLVLSMSPISIESCIDMDLSYNRAMEMLADMKGKNVDCGARFFRFLFLYYQNQNDSNKCINILNSLEKKLELGIDESKKNIALACYKYNIHGYFAAFKFILEIINFQIFSKEYIYYLFDRLIDFSFDSWGVVKEILQHESPEGNLPKSIEENYSPELESKYGRGTQIISSYSWRTLKESTNLLDIILKNRKFPVSDETILKIGPLLLEQLATIRHRGAFSSVYPTFVSCCFACQNRPEISNTPKKWLYHNLSLIQSRSKYITRRSAGIPFLITAILTTDKSLISPTFNELLTVAKLPVDAKENIDNFNLPQVNAFNCIKVIFIDSSLSDTSVLFVDKALELALNSFGSPFWAIRNCAVMLFTALQNRLFSSKKVRNNYLPTYPARLFFNKFMSIKDIFLQNLNEAISSGLTEQSQIEKIFPILTIMSRLEPTPNYTGLEEFKPLVLIFLENATWKVREMAARSLPALINSKNSLNEHILLLMDNIKIDDKSNNNKIHGSLLAVKELIMRSNEESFNNSLELKGDLLTQNEKLRKAILSKVDIILNYVDSYAIKLAFLQIIKHIVLDTELHKKEILELYLWFDGHHQIGKCLDGSKQLALRCLGEILLNLNENSNLTDLINKCLFSSLYELQICAINFCETNLTTSLLSNELKKQLVYSIWNLLEMPNVWKYVKSQALKLLKQLIMNNNHKEDSMDCFRVHTNKLIELCNDESNEDIKLNCVEALGSYIAKFFLNESDSTKNIDIFNFWLLKLKSMIEDDLEFVVRLSALKSLIGFNEIYFNYGREKQRKLLITGLIFEFLNDDDEDIRQLASYHLAKLVLKLQVCDIVSVEIENLMIDYFIRTAGENALLFVEPKLFHFYDDKTLFTDLFVEDHLLFTVEKHNVYQNSITKLEELVKIIENTGLKYSKTELGHLISVVDKNLVEIELFLLNNNHPTDGCFGWLTDEYKFNFVYGTFLINSCLKKCGLYDRDITHLLKFLNNEGEYIHPLILQVSET